LQSGPGTDNPRYAAVVRKRSGKMALR